MTPQAAPTSADIQAYWNERAASQPNDPAATTNDIHLRNLEALRLARILADFDLSPNDQILDVGCGDGRTISNLAKKFPHVIFAGIDYSHSMIRSAHIHAEHLPNVGFHVDDVTSLSCEGSLRSFRVVISVRCLINLPDAERQAQAIAQIATRLRAGDHYVAIENFHEGHEALNDARISIGLPSIDIRWHNRYFREREFAEMTSPFFNAPRYIDFASSYYFATRVIYSKFCQLQDAQPDYNHAIHELAVNLPSVGCLSPVRLVVLQRK